MLYPNAHTPQFGTFVARQFEALARLGRDEDKAARETLAQSESDLVVREAAMRVVKGWDAASE